MPEDRTNIQEPAAERPQVRSKPLYRKRLVISSILFAVLILADIGVVGYLVFRYLSERTVAEALERSREGAHSLARKLEEEMPVGDAGGSDGPATLLRVRELNRIVDRFVEDVLVRRHITSHVIVLNSEGNVIYQTESLRGKRFSLRPTPLAPGEGPGPSPYYRRGELTVGSRRESVYEIVVPVNSGEMGKGGSLHLLLPERNLEERVAGVRATLITSVLVGAALSMVSLIVAFFYMLRLLNRAQQLEAEAQMADRLTYVGSLAYGLAHEIRNPLNAMNLNIQMLEEELAELSEKGGLEGESLEMLEGTRREVQRLERLVTDFLAYARPQKLKMEPEDPNELVSEVIRFLEAQFRRKNVRLDGRLGLDLPRIRADRGRLKQALINVLNNAADAVSSDTGRVEVVTSSARENGFVSIAVADNGQGIPPQEAENVFKVFHSTKRGGTGLGLAITRRIIESHGGSIELRQRSGGGAMFEILLPSIGG